MVSGNHAGAKHVSGRFMQTFLKSVVDAHCPVLDLFSNATPVEIAVAGHI
jgi:hypothetical protein